MPTGYTAGILSGSIKDFKEFAVKCSRAFIIHMRDEPMDSKYKERTPGKYHTDAIERESIKLQEANTLTDHEIIAKKLADINESKDYHIKAIAEAKVGTEKLERMLKEAKAYKPPTEAHVGIAKFMIQQLTDTIKHDFGGNYHENELKRIAKKIQAINPDEVRAQMKEGAAEDLAYHTKEQAAELERCEDHNKWYKDFINSLD